MKRLGVWLVLIILFSSMLVLPFQSMGGRGAPVVGEDDIYTKEAELEDTVEFTWIVSRTSDTDYAVKVNITKGMDAWEKNVEPSYFVLDDDNPYKMVTFEVTVPRYPEKESREATISFSFRVLNGTERTTIEKNVVVNIKDDDPLEKREKILGLFDNPLPDDYKNMWTTLGLNLLVWFLIALIIFFLIDPVIHRLAKRTETTLDDALVKLLSKPVLLFVFLYGAIDSLLKLNLGLGTQVFLWKVYKVALIIIGVVVVYKIIDAVLEEVAERRGGEESAFNNVLKPVIEKLVAVFILIGGLILGLRMMGMEVTTLLAGAGILGLVIAFAAQDTMSNFFSGMHLLLDRPFKIGETILIESGEYCRVMEIGMRSTKLYSIFDHEVIILPNNLIANQKIINLVKPNSQIRNRVEVNVAYGSDVKKVKNILMEVAEKTPNVLTDEGHEPLIRFKEFGDSSLNFTLVIWIDDVDNQWEVMSNIREQVDRRFREEGVTIPFPQRTVWMHQGD